MIYHLDHFSLDAKRRELRRGPDLIAVEPSVFDLLLYLLANRDRVVSKDDLIATVWKGRIVSDSTLTSRINAARHAIGDSGAQQLLIRTIPRKGLRFVGKVHDGHTAAQTDSVGASAMRWIADAAPPLPAVSFIRAKDRTSLAVAAAGRGPLLVRAAHWYTHIEAEWQNPLTAPLLHRLASQRRLIFYDGRGAGLSDRNVPDMSFESYESDLEAVAEELKLEQFALLGMSGGAATAIAFAARNPERVSKLVLYGGYALGRNKRRSPQTADQAKAFLTMIRSAWNDPSSPFWRAFSSFFLPNATPDQFKWFSDLHSTAFSMESGIMARTGVDEIDVSGLLSEVSTPTIVFHCMRDKLVPFEQGRHIATSIPNAKFVPLDSENHTLLPQEPAWAKFVSEAEEFLRSNG